MKIRQRNLPKPLRTQYKVQNNEIGENQQVFRKDHDELIVKNGPKRNQTIVQQPIFKLPPNCPSIKRNLMAGTW